MYGLNVTPNMFPRKNTGTRINPHPTHGNKSYPSHHQKESNLSKVAKVGLLLLGKLVEAVVEELKPNQPPTEPNPIIQTKERVIENLKFRIEYIDILYKFDFSNAVIIPSESGNFIDSKIYVDFTLNESFDEFLEENEKSFLDKLQNELKLTEPPEIIEKRKGSVILTIAIVAGGIGTLLLLNKYRQLPFENVSDIELTEKKKKTRNNKLINKFKNEIAIHLIEILTDIVRFVNPSSRQQKNEAVLALARANDLKKMQNKRIIGNPAVLIAERNSLFESILEFLDELRHSDVNDGEADELEKKYLKD